MSAADQLPLPLPSAPRYGIEDFLVGAVNAAAFAHIERWPRWLAPAAVIAGPEGSGKSHLAAIFAARSGATMLRGDHLTRDRVPDLAARPALVIEDCDRFPPEEAALFHLLNLARERGFFVVMTGRTRPDFWGIRTPDLLSRLRAQPLLELAEPDDALLGALAVKHFADHQIVIDAGVVSYALARVERSYAAVQALVAALDRQSLVLKRPVTKAMVADVLGRDSPAEEAPGEAD